MSTSEKTRKSSLIETDVTEKLDLIDTELVSFFQFCERMGFNKREMEEICSPLHLVDKPRFRMYQVFTVTIALSLLLFAGHQSTFISFHSAALGRMALVKALKLWDWRAVFYEPCLIKNPSFQRGEITEEHCLACEDVSTIDVVSNADYDTVIDTHLNRDIPLIVTDAMDDWPVMQTDAFSFNNITDIYQQDEELSDYIPCAMMTNLRVRTGELHSLLKLINNAAVSQWFAHWKNCDTNAMKALRMFYQRPYFLPNTAPPAHYNWVLLSSDYGSNNMKKVELDQGLIMLSQLRGSTVFKLLPINACKKTCPVLSNVLNAGETLVFKNDLWNFHYHPGIQTDNIGILLEMAWELTT